MTELTRRGLLQAAGALGTVTAISVSPPFTRGAAAQQSGAQQAGGDAPSAGRPIDLGSRLELMAGTRVVDELDGAQLRLNPPVRREVVMTTDKPWEGSASHYRQIFKDGDIFRMYYLGLDYDVHDGAVEIPHPGRIAYAESEDGINWTRANLGLVEFDGSTENNLVAGLKQSHTYVFKDANPDVAKDAQYKAIEYRSSALYALKSADGLTFEPMSGEPLMRSGPQSEHGLTNMSFDSLNVAFWDHEIGKYRLYIRYYLNRESGGLYRAIMTATSDNFLTWSAPEPLEYPGSPAPEEQLYTNNVLPYYRSPGILLGFPMRYVQPPGWLESHYHLPGLDHRRERFLASERYGTAMTDTLFMSSRDGKTFDRWDEAFIRPGPGTENWKYADNSMGRGLIETKSHINGAPNELSVYATEGYWTGDELDIVRYTMRIDGFVSVNAPRSGGEVVTRPLQFTGDQLVLNLASSAAGRVRVEIQDPGGEPVPGFSLEESDPLFGDDLARIVTWRGGEWDLSSLKRRPVRLRFALNDADIYSLRFRPAITFESTRALIDGYHSSGILTPAQRQDLLTHLSAAQTASEDGRLEDAEQALDQFGTVAAAVSDDAASTELVIVAEELRRQVREANAEAWPTRYGWLLSDVEPTTGNLDHIGLSTALFALDYRKRSIGAVLWEPGTITKLTLRDLDETTRLVPSDLSVYVSDRNDGDWRLVEGAEVSRTSTAFVFTGLNVTARYVKVVQPYTDTAFTFTNQISKMLEVTTG